MTATVAAKTASKIKEPFYPTSDGEPMAETDLHWDVTAYCCKALRSWFAPQPNVYVASDNFLYYEQGKPSSVVSPDCYVIFGVEMRMRDSYKSWENGDHFPSVVIEITSKSTRNEDTQSKYRKYQDVLRVAEYFLFDPTADYISTRLRGYRLGENGYAPIEPDADGRLHSEQLGLELTVQGNRLKFFDAQRGVYLPDYNELEVALEAQSQRAEQESLRAEQEAQRAEQETNRAEQEAQRAESAEAEIARLKAELARLQSKE